MQGYELPSELWGEIFERVEPICILECRRVCHSWCDIIARKSRLLSVKDLERACEIVTPSGVVSITLTLTHIIDFMDVNHSRGYDLVSFQNIINFHLLVGLSKSRYRPLLHKVFRTYARYVNFYEVSSLTVGDLGKDNGIRSLDFIPRFLE